MKTILEMASEKVALVIRLTAECGLRVSEAAPVTLRTSLSRQTTVQNYYDSVLMGRTLTAPRRGLNHDMLGYIRPSMMISWPTANEKISRAMRKSSTYNISSSGTG